MKKEDIIFAEKPDTTVHPFKTFKDLEGQIFGRLTVLGYAGRTRHTYWWCECNCPNRTIKKIRGSHLSKGNTVSCKCFNTEVITKHGMWGSPEYKIWNCITQRCNNPNDTCYSYYGGRGIKVKFNSFEEFYEEVGDMPKDGQKYSIERVNNNGHYEPGNVKWATQKEQTRNKRNNRNLTFLGVTMCYTDWAIKVGISKEVLGSRINKRGWCIECALTILPTKGKCVHKTDGQEVTE